jgi:hypothetical protein
MESRLDVAHCHSALKTEEYHTTAKRNAPARRSLLGGRARMLRWFVR